MFPFTIVDNPSTIEDLLSPLKSTDTSGNSHNPNIPLSSFSDASLITLFISSTVVSFSTSHTKSVIDTAAVGTLNANPSNLPFN